MIVGFKMKGKGIARTGYQVLNTDEQEIGFVTTGSYSPTLDKKIGMAILSETKLKLEMKF